MKVKEKKGAPESPRNTRIFRRIRRERVRSGRETFLRNLLHGRQRNMIPMPDVPVEVVFLSSDDEEFHPWQKLVKIPLQQMRDLGLHVVCWILPPAKRRLRRSPQIFWRLSQPPAQQDSAESN